MELESAHSNVLHVDSHTSGHFRNNETAARAAFYGVSGVPHIRVDGSRSSVGGGDGCQARFNNYNSLYNARIAETSGLSPVEIVDTNLSFTATTAELTATFRLVDPVALGTVSSYFFLYEDDIHWCCGYAGINHWDRITRSIKSEGVTTLINVGDQVTITKSITLDPGWVVDNLHAVACLQQTTNPKPIIQAADLPRTVDFTLTVPLSVHSLPNGSSEALFTGQLHNDTDSQDTYNISVDQAAGWPTAFQVDGDSNWYTTLPLVLTGGTSKQITVRVQTDAALRIGVAGFTVQSQASGRLQNIGLRVFNHSYAIMLVDDDGGLADWNGLPFQQLYADAMNSLGYLHQDWDVAGAHGDNAPSADDLHGFDAAIWVTGRETGTVITTDDIAAIQTYLDQGGALYFESMNFLNTQTSITTFLANYLGVGGFVRDTSAHTLTGVAGDPISNGMTLPVTFPQETMNDIDAITPRPTAVGILRAETSDWNAIRNLTATTQSRVVFSTVTASALSRSAPDPNNVQTLTSRILRYLVPPDPTGIAENPGQAETHFLSAQPNPFPSSTRLSFLVSPRAAASPVELLLIDPSGRQVRSLVRGSLAAGTHQATWDALDDAGRPVATGVYFARLKSVDGERSVKVILAH